MRGERSKIAMSIMTTEELTIWKDRDQTYSVDEERGITVVIPDGLPRDTYVGLATALAYGINALNFASVPITNIAYQLLSRASSRAAAKALADDWPTEI